MQTFLPYPSFEATVACLDYRRLGKQRVEAMQILNALERKGAWYNHPATQMWKGFENVLKHYYNNCVTEWVRRGYKNTMKLLPVELYAAQPSWLGEEEFHAAHRSNLLRKDSAYYSKFGWKEPDNLAYVWPI
jgi:hypothetical protein